MQRSRENLFCPRDCHFVPRTAPVCFRDGSGLSRTLSHPICSCLLAFLAREAKIRDGRIWAIVVRRGSYKCLFLNSGHFSQANKGDSVLNFGSLKTLLIAMAQILSPLKEVDSNKTSKGYLCACLKWHFWSVSTYHLKRRRTIVKANNSLKIFLPKGPSRTKISMESIISIRKLNSLRWRQNVATESARKSCGKREAKTVRIVKDYGRSNRNQKTMTARDVTGFCAFFSARKSGKFSPHFGSISWSNYTVNLEKKEISTGENIFKNPVETAPPKLQISVPCRGRTGPEAKCYGFERRTISSMAGSFG